MPTESNGKKPPKQDLNFAASGVLAVREDEGRPPEFISQPFDFRVRYQLPGLILFHLAVTLADSVAAETATKTTVYLQITADQIHSLKKSNHDTADTNPSNPSCLENVRRQLNGVRSVTRLNFRLYSGKRAKLIVPRGFTTENASEDPAFGAAESLAVSSLFSLYFRHDILAREKFGVYRGAIRDFPDLAITAKPMYEAMVDLSRLYHGAGGKEHTPREYHRGPRSTRDRCSSPAPGSPASRGSGSTLPFDETPSRQGYRGSLPPYDECVDEKQSPRAASEAASIVAISPGSDCDPPEYDDAEQRDDDDVLDSLQGVLACGNQDNDARPTTKRKRSITSVCTKTTSRTDAHRPERSQRSLVDQLMRVVDQQQRKIDQLEQKFEESQRRNKKLETRCDELEGKWYEMENRQAGNEASLEITDIAVDELEAKCNTLEDRMLDVCDEVKDLMEGIGSTAKEEIRKTVGDSMAKDVEEIVDARLNKVKGMILKAFESI